MRQGELYRLCDSVNSVWHWRKSGTSPMRVLCGRGDVLDYLIVTVMETDTVCQECELLAVLERFCD